MPNFIPQETLCWMFTADCTDAVRLETILWMLTQYCTWKFFEPKVFPVWWWKFLHAEGPGKPMKEITGLRLWHVMGRFMRDEENVVIIFYWNTTDILYHIPPYVKTPSVCNYLLFSGWEKEEGRRLGRGKKKKCGNIPELGKEKYIVANTYGITMLWAKWNIMQTAVWV